MHNIDGCKTEVQLMKLIKTFKIHIESHLTLGCILLIDKDKTQG